MKAFGNLRKGEKCLSAACALLMVAAGAALAAEVDLGPYTSGMESPIAYAGGKNPPYSPNAWGDTTLPLIAPALTIVSDNVIGMEGFLHPEPGASLSNLGGFSVPGMNAKGKLKDGSTSLRAIMDYGNGTEIHLNRISPGLLLKTQAAQIELFIRADMGSEGWRVAGRASRPPAYVAFVQDNRAVVHKAEGTISLEGMEEPWILVWWAGSVQFETPVRPNPDASVQRQIYPIYPASSGLPVQAGKNEWPMLIVLQKRAKSLTATDEKWVFDFNGPAGSTIVTPLYGRRPVTTESLEEWKTGIPAGPGKHARAWTRRLRAIPVDVRETMALADGVPIFTESFTYETITDDWNTRPSEWAPIPPMLAVAWKRGFPIKLVHPNPRMKIQDFGWLHRLGPIAGIDGVSEISYRIAIPQLETYLSPARSDSGPVGGKQAELLRAQLNQEIGNVINAGHMAPHQFDFGETGSSLYSTTYFVNQYELFCTLTRALPHLDRELAARLKRYLRREFRAFSPFEQYWWDSIGQRKGALRERYPPDPCDRGWVNGTNFNLQNLYAAWLFAEDIFRPADLWQRSREYFQEHCRRAPVEWDYMDRVRFNVKVEWKHDAHLAHRNHPSSDNRFESANSRLNGLIGYVRLARMFKDRAEEERGTCLLARAFAHRFAQIEFDRYLIDIGIHSPENVPAIVRARAISDLQSTTLMRGLYIGPWLIWTYVWRDNPVRKATGDNHIGDRIYRMHLNHPTWSGGEYGSGVAAGREQVIETSAFYLGLDLTPELARFYRDYCGQFARLSFEKAVYSAPTWYMADGPMYWSSEENCAPPEVPWALFMARSLILEPEAEEIYRTVDFPQAAFGDLYYIQKLCVALDAFGMRR